MALPANAAKQLSAQQSHIPPFTTHNWLPTSLIFGIPSFSTKLLSAEKPVALNFQITTANTFVKAVNESERLALDGEVTVALLSASWRLNERWQLSFFAPYVDHSGGVWDDLIEDWHDWFSLPQAGRDESTNNQFSYTYQRNDTSLLDYNTETGSIGDVRFTLSRALAFDKHSFLYHIEFKAPTGKPEKITGSGAWDVSTGLGWHQHSLFEFANFSQFFTLGVSYLGNADLALAEFQKRTVWSGRAGLQWHALKWISFSAQFDTHTSLYDSNLKTLGGTSLQLTFGGHILLADSFRVDLSIGEDLRTRVTPDFVVNLAVAYRY